MDREKWGYVLVREEQEPGSSGLAVIRSRRNKLASQGFNYDGVHTTGEKTINWGPFAAMAKTPSAEAGAVKLLRGAWNHEWLTEMERVPKHTNDDQADSVSGAFNDLTVGSGGMAVVATHGY